MPIWVAFTFSRVIFPDVESLFQVVFQFVALLFKGGVVTFGTDGVLQVSMDEAPGQGSFYDSRGVCLDVVGVGRVGFHF